MARFSQHTTKTTSLRAAVLAGLVTSILGAPTAAFAWGSPGHQYVGNLAWPLLNPNARHHVQLLLGPGVTLGQAAVWPDCVRSVSGSPSAGYHYHSDNYTPGVCSVFGNSPAEVQRMTDYASRNWTNCSYSGHLTKCNLSYHFADVNVHEHSDYQASYFGTEPYDVVHAIEAAEVVLRCKSGATCLAPSPFNITDKREALLMLAHFIGDVHQPLHVGAVYLDANNAETGDNGTPTIGGNFLLLPSAYSANLHHSWDEIPSNLGTAPSAAAIASACQIAPLPNPVADPPEKWASESVEAARTAYNGMTFTPDANQPKDWDVQFQDPSSYSTMRRSLQVQRLVSAGARLAEVLNSVWPSKKAATACKAAIH
jgi:hypothetical protein